MQSMLRDREKALEEKGSVIRVWRILEVRL